MVCRNPYISNSGAAYGCGQCLFCRINRRRIWTLRLSLESLMHSSNAFLTLTYRTEDLRLSPSKMPTLDPSDLRLFLYRLRKELRPQRIRFYGVGEYGDKTERPHYHLILFNAPQCRWTRTRNKKLYSVCCDVCDMYERVWSHGLIDVGTVQQESIAYCAGYVCKKMTQADDPRLGDRHPEFCRMSNRPGIGRDFMLNVASSLMEQKGLLESLVDVPGELRTQGKKWPIGRYLKQWLRRYVGRDHQAPQEVLDALQAQMQPVLEAAYSFKTPGIDPLKMVKEALISFGDSKAAGREARERIYSKEKVL